MIVLCSNRKCEHYRDEVCKIDKTNCRIFMWDEIENCPESIVEQLNLMLCEQGERK